jgi:metal-dependent amidase/aminoacylase/carboxypeptidase family protein
MMSRSPSTSAPRTTRTCDFRFERNYPPTINTEAEADFARRVMGDIVGADNVLAGGRHGRRKTSPSCCRPSPAPTAFIGNGDGAHRDVHHGEGPCTLHNPSYDFNDDLIPLGATCWVQLAEQFLAGHAGRQADRMIPMIGIARPFRRATPRRARSSCKAA